MPVAEAAALPLRWRWDDSPELLRQVLEAAGVVAMPSESSYGLAADPRSAEAVAAIFRLKQRPADKPLLVVLSDTDQLADLGVRVPDSVRDQLAAVWPAALTAVLPIEEPLAASGGSSSLAVRVPAHRRLRQLLRQLGPLTSTSANRADEPPLCRPSELIDWMSAAGVRCPLAVVDDGELPGGPPSTLVAWEPRGWRLLRPGAVDWPAARLRQEQG